MLSHGWLSKVIRVRTCNEKLRFATLSSMKLSSASIASRFRSQSTLPPRRQQTQMTISAISLAELFSRVRFQSCVLSPAREYQRPKCGALDIPNDSLAIHPENFGMQNLIVYLRKAPKEAIYPELAKSKSETRDVSLKNCRFHPHMVALRSFT